MSKPEYPRVGLMTDAGHGMGRPLDTVISLDLSYGKLLVLADGLGAGESPTASEIAVDTLSRVFRDQQPDFSMERAVPRFIQYAMQDANRDVFKAAQLTGSPTEFGASVVLALIIDANVYVGYCGSARMVVVRNSTPTRVTRDYSTLGAGGDGEHKSASARIAKPMGFDPELSPAVFAGPIQLRTGDLFILCSDGLYEAVEDGDIGSVAESGQAEDAVVQLVGMAKERNGKDSISLVIYQTDAPIVEAVDETEGVVMADPDHSPTEPVKLHLPPPPAKRANVGPASGAKALPWLVIAAASAATVLVVALLLWAPWAPDDGSSSAGKMAQTSETAAAMGAEQKLGEAGGVNGEAGDEGSDPANASELAGKATPNAAADSGDENEPPSGGRIIEVTPPIPIGKAQVTPFAAKGTRVKEPSKLGASGVASKSPKEVEAVAKAAARSKAGGTQAAANEGKDPAESPDKVAVLPVNVTAPVKPQVKEGVAQGDDDWPEEGVPGGKVAKKTAAEARKLTAAEAKKAAAEAKKAEKEAKKAVAEAKKAEKEDQKAAAEAKKKAVAEAKKKEAEAKKNEAEAKKKEAEAKKKEAEAKKKEAEAKKNPDQAAKVVPETVASKQVASTCSTHGLKGKSGTAVQKVIDAVQKGKELAKKADGSGAAEQYQSALWQLKNSKEAAARCTGMTDELRSYLADLYVRLTEYQAKKKQCKAARGRAKDATAFGATEAQLKKALGSCYVKKDLPEPEADAPDLPKPAPPKSAKGTTKSTKPAVDEDLEP